jgi:signal peptidase II
MKKNHYLIVLLIIVFDHITKWLAGSMLDRSRVIEIIPGYLRFSYVENSGVAFGLFNNVESAWKPFVLAAMAVVAVTAIIFYGTRLPRERILLQLALALCMGGIIGNFIDRITRGYVVDFIEFHIHKAFHFPNFNIADSAITIGISLLLIDTMKNPSSEGSRQSAVGDSS